MARRGGRKFDDDELHWYALDVMRQKEFLAGYFLQKRGCVTFIPTETRFRKRNRYTKGGKIEVAYANIPGTIFVGFPGPPNWFEVMNMNLVNGVLSVDDQPRRIDTSGKEWLDYRGHQIDGSLVIEKQLVRFKGEDVERSAALISMQGRGVLRSSRSIRARADVNRPVVIRAAGQRAIALGALLSNMTPQPLRAAA